MLGHEHVSTWTCKTWRETNRRTRYEPPLPNLNGRTDGRETQRGRSVSDTSSLVKRFCCRALTWRRTAARRAGLDTPTPAFSLPPPSPPFAFYRRVAKTPLTPRTKNKNKALRRHSPPLPPPPQAPSTTYLPALPISLLCVHLHAHI